jgi:hypothetical protein
VGLKRNIEEIYNCPYLKFMDMVLFVVLNAVLLILYPSLEKRTDVTVW